MFLEILNNENKEIFRIPSNFNTSINLAVNTPTYQCFGRDAIPHFICNKIHHNSTWYLGWYRNGELFVKILRVLGVKFEFGFYALSASKAMVRCESVN